MRSCYLPIILRILLQFSRDTWIIVRWLKQKENSNNLPTVHRDLLFSPPLSKFSHLSIGYRNYVENPTKEVNEPSPVLRLIKRSSYRFNRDCAFET